MTYRIFSILSLVILSLGVMAQNDSQSGNSYLHFSNFWSGEKDATPAMLNLLNSVRKNNIEVIEFDSGEYHFYPEKAYEQYCYVPNHDNSLKRVAIPIVQQNTLTIKGHGARFIMHGLIMPFLIENSQNIHIEGISIDWEVPLHSEVEVIAIDNNENSFDVSIGKDQPYLIRNGELIFVKEGFEHNLETAILFDKAKHRVLYQTKAYTPLPYKTSVPLRHEDAFQYPYEPFLAYPGMMQTQMERKIEAVEIKPGIVRIKGSAKQLPPIGSVLVCKGAGGTSRLIPALYLHQSSDVTISSVNIYHAGGMGVIAEGCNSVGMEQVYIGVEEGSKRMVSTTADATHFLNCRGKISFNNCSFSNQLDDATNVHGAYMVVEDIIDEKTIGARVGHFQQQGMFFGVKGDTVAFVNQEQSVHPFDENVIEQIQKLNAGYYKVTFKTNIDSRLKKGMVIENLDAYPEVTITNSRFFNNRARGILLSTPRKVVVENNYFSNMMSAIFMPVELSYWYESGHSQDVLIRNNTFEDSSYGGRNLAVINIHTSLDNHDYVFGNIAIVGNNFKQFDAAILKANGVQKLSFINNTIGSSQAYQPLFPDSPSLKLEHIQELTIQKNTFGGIANKKLEISEVEKEVIKNNKGIK